MNRSAITIYTRVKLLDLNDDELLFLARCAGIRSLPKLCLLSKRFRDLVAPSLRLFRPLTTKPFGISFRAIEVKSYIDMDNKGLKENDVDAFSCVLSNWALPNLKSLYLPDNQIGDVGITALANALGKGALPSLQYLDLECSAIGDVGMIALSNALGKGALPSLMDLDMDGNAIGDAGMQAFANVLGNGALPNLKHVYLSDNQIGDVGITALADALMKQFPALVSLNLYNNEISDVGMAALTDALRTKALASLQTFDISGNKVSDDFFKALKEVLGF